MGFYSFRWHRKLNANEPQETFKSNALNSESSQISNNIFSKKTNFERSIETAAVEVNDL